MNSIKMPFSCSQKAFTSEYCLELFPLSKSCLKQIHNGIPACEYLVKIPTKIQQLYDKKTAQLSCCARALRSHLELKGTWLSEERNIMLILGEGPEKISCYGFNLVDNKDYEFELTLKKKTKIYPQKNFGVFQRIANREISHAYKKKEDYQVSGNTVVHTNYNWMELIKKSVPKETDEKLDASYPILSNIINVYSSCDFGLRKYGKRILLATDVHHTIQTAITLEDLIDKGYNADAISRLSNSFNYTTGGSALFIDFLYNKTVSSPLGWPPFEGRTYLDFVKDLYPEFSPLFSRKAKSSLIWGQPYRISDAWTYAAILSKPTLTFETISRKNPPLYRSIQKLFRSRTPQRLDDAKSFIKQLGIVPLTEHIALEFDANSLYLEGKPWDIDLTQSAQSAIGKPDLLEIRRPPLAFKDEKNDERLVLPGYPTADHSGTLHDLMIDPEALPYVGVDRVRLAFLIPEDYKIQSNLLCQNIQNGYGLYRGFSKTFGADLEIDPIEVSGISLESYKEAIAEVNKDKYDVAAVVIPSKARLREERSVLGTSIYSEPKVTLLRKYVPNQMVTEGVRTHAIDRTLAGKARDALFLFNFSAQIAAKRGIVTCALPQKTAEALSCADVLIGYDLIYVPLYDRIAYKQKWDRKGKPPVPQVKMACPLIIVDNQGVKVSYVGVRWLDDESLFYDLGDFLYDKLKGFSPRTVTVQKNGRFTEDELFSLEYWLDSKGLEGSALSITRSLSPRNYRVWRGKCVVPKHGTALRISKDRFIMNTSGYPVIKDPTRKGWPRTVMIRFHKMGRYVPNYPLLLSQIYSFTQIHTGSILPTRLPISLHFPNLIGRVLRATHTTLPDFLFSMRTKEGLVPRWFY